MDWLKNCFVFKSFDSPDSMNIQKAAPSGTDPEATRDSILASELSRLQASRTRMKEENQVYLERHPEIRSLLDEFVAGIIRDKPSDLIKYGSLFFNSLRSRSGMGPSPVVIAGPSGVGKGTIIKVLMERFPSIFGFSVSHTTRAPRPGEENDVHYHFVEKSVMDEMVRNNEFIEFANVHTNMYGTSVAAVEKVRSEGKICILDIDIQGVQKVKKSPLECKYLFIAPPSLEMLHARLRGRGTETEEKIAVRMKNATAELAYGTIDNFDSVVVNNDLDLAVEEIIFTLQGWFPDLELESPASK